jgi:hypothetical protein
MAAHECPSFRAASTWRRSISSAAVRSPLARMTRARDLSNGSKRGSICQGYLDERRSLIRVLLQAGSAPKSAKLRVT